MDVVPLHIEEAAMEWLLRLESDSSLECRRAFRNWCEKSRDHVQAFLEVTVLDRQLDRIDPQGRVDIDALINEVRAAASENIVALGNRPAAASYHTSIRWRRIGQG